MAIKRFLLIPDKFKGSLSAADVINGLTQSIKNVYPDAYVKGVMASDGGDGFLAAIQPYRSVQRVMVSTVDALGRPLDAPILFDNDEKVAFVELAQASGLAYLPENQRSPLVTSTIGTGIQLKKAIDMGAKTIYIGLGGSATNDGGIGLATALGYCFLDDKNEVLAPIGENLQKIQKILPPEGPFPLPKIIAVNDVDNPLYGPNGAAAVYAAQKGADAKAIAALDKGLQQLEKITKATLRKDAANLPGSGAAGGTAYGLKVFVGAEFQSGIGFMLAVAKVANLLSQKPYDAIITGEGKIDAQTVQGKLIQGVIDLGARFQVPVIAFCGRLDLDVAQQQLGPQAFIEIGDRSKSLAYNMENAAMLLQQNCTTYLKTAALWN
ncbi:MAG: glycerate kinase [Bacteroidota bacterium]